MVGLGVRRMGQVWKNSGEGSSTTHNTQLYCFTGPELLAVNYSFQFLLLLDFIKAHFYVFPLIIYVILEGKMHEAQS